MIYASLDEEKKLWDSGFELVCGLDEVGRGCFAGPAVVAGVVFAKDSELIEGIADSKLLSKSKREILAEEIKLKALDWKIVVIEVGEINLLGVDKAVKAGWARVVDELSNFPDFLLVDAFSVPGVDLSRQKGIVHGDQISASIAGASIIAKVYRDDLMDELDRKYPGYDLALNKGYGTAKHRAAIGHLGLCDLHRNFNLSAYVNV